MKLNPTVKRYLKYFLLGILFAFMCWAILNTFKSKKEYTEPEVTDPYYQTYQQ